MGRRIDAQLLRAAIHPRSELDRVLEEWVGNNTRALFDPAWYFATYPDARSSGLPPIKHYREIGSRLGYDPHPDFDTDWYRTVYPDVEPSGLDSMQHFLRDGASNRRNPNPMFSTAWYLRTYPDVAEAGVNALEHYMRYGRAEGRYPSALHAWWRREPAVLWASDGSGPLVTIVIPVHGQWAFTERCLRAIAASEAQSLAKVLVVDDRSPDDTLGHLRRYPWAQVLRLPENVGYTRAVNRGSAGVDTPYLLLLNNDTEPLPGFLNAMLDRMHRDPSIGIVGSRLVYGDGTLQEAGSTLWEDASGFNYGKGDAADLHNYTFSREVDYCSAASLLVRTDIWQRLGGFDERYAPAYYEDSDLAFAVRELGMKVVYEPSSVVVHHEGMSHGTDLAQGLKAHQVVNQRAFRDKWREVLNEHPRDGEFPRAVCSVPGRPRIMFVVSEHPIAAHRDSGSRRMTEIFDIWRAQGYRVAVFGPMQDPNSDDSLLLRRDGVELITAPDDAAAFLSENSDWVAAIWYSHALSAFRWRKHLRRAAKDIPSVLDTVDLHHLRESAQAELDGSTLGALRADTSRLQEFWSIDRTDATVVVSETELAYLEATAPDAAVHLISNIHGRCPDGPPLEERKGLLFVGSFAHSPNGDAVTWFVDEVWPLLPAEVRADGLDVVGGPAPTELCSRGVPGVRVHGWVPDVAPFLTAARLSVAPLRYGGGVKGKVGEAWASGLPVIGTPVALDGMADPGTYPMADSAVDLAALVGRTYLDAAEWHRLRELGRGEVERRFSAARAADVLADLQRTLDQGRKIQNRWRARVAGRICPWDLPGWPGEPDVITLPPTAAAVSLPTGGRRRLTAVSPGEAPVAAPLQRV